MKRSILPALCLALVAGCEFGSRSLAQTASDPAGSAPPTAPAAPAQASTNAAALIPVPPVPVLPAPVSEVIQLTRRGLSEGVVTDFIAQIQEPYTLTADQLIYLNDLGISGPVLQALIRKSGPGSAPPAAAATQTVIVQSPQVPITTSVPAKAAESNVILNPYLASTAAAAGPAGQTPQTAVGNAPEAPAGTPTVQAPRQPAVVSKQIFYESLSPYGTWVEVDGYGWCWQPTVAVVNPGWIPYGDGGQWAWTDSGWYWNSSYTWGWGPYHYGRWHRHVHHGWVWTPGYDWAPAWVAWRSSPTYCGWAPLPPECRWSSGVGFSWVNGHTSVSVGFGIGYDWWFATTWNRFCEPVRPGHRLPPHGMRQFVNDSRIAVGSGNGVNIHGNNNTVIINNGISRDEVQRHTREEIRRTEIRDVGSPAAARAFTASRPSPSGGRPSELAVYRPSIPTQAPRPAPSVLSRQEASRPSVSRPVTTSFTPSGSPSRPLTVPSASSTYTAPRPAPITGLTSTRPQASQAPAVSGTTPVRPGGNGIQASPSRGEVSRPAPAFGGAEQRVPATAPTITSPITSTRPAPGNGAAQFRPEPAQNFTPAAPNKPQYRSPAPYMAKPAFEPVNKPSQYTPPEGFRPSPGQAPSPSYSAPSRPAPAPSSGPAPSRPHGSPQPGRKNGEP